MSDPLPTINIKKGTTFGKFIADRRALLGMSLKELGLRVHKENGHTISAQYLHDMENDRRTPSENVLNELAKALTVDVDVLAAVAGRAPAAVLDYLKANPAAARSLADAAQRARKSGTTDWSAIT